jgi:iron complex transport system ATP-binding protein
VKFEARDLTYSYREGGRRVLGGITCTIESGTYWCIAGPNGSGKSTLLRLASGLLPLGFLQGELLWDSKPIRDFDRLELARSVAFVSGSLNSRFPVTVGQFVLQGRFAHAPTFWSRPTPKDLEVAAQCLEKLEIVALADKTVTELSAGEAQLAMLARALAQEPKVVILDEATANLDLRHQIAIFDLLSKLKRQGLTIIVVSHDVNLAAEFCPNALWLNDGRVYSQGTMEETLSPTLMQDLYDVGERVEIGRSPASSRPKIFWRPST